MNAPTVSILVPVYNAQSTLRRCVESLIAQTFHDIEIILVDDGSTDGSGRMCGTYAEEFERIRVFHKENGGAASARNAGLRRARGKYIAFADADDFLEPEAIKKLVEAMERSGAGLVVCSFARIIGEERHPVKLGIEGMQAPTRQVMEFAYGLPDALLRFGACWNKLYKRDTIENNGLGFDEALRITDDLHFNFNYIKRIKGVFFVDEPLYNYIVPAGRASVTTAYRLRVFEINECAYQAVEEAIGASLNAKERSVLNRHYIDKILIVLKMLCRPNDVYTDEEMLEKLREIVNHPHVRGALADCWHEGTQENEAVEWLQEREYERLFTYAKDGGKKMYGGIA